MQVFASADGFGVSMLDTMVKRVVKGRSKAGEILEERAGGSSEVLVFLS